MSDAELRLECAKLAVAMGAGLEMVERVAARLFEFVKRPPPDTKP